MNSEESTLDVLPEVESELEVAPVPRCATGGCGGTPVARYTWPGRDESIVCQAHALAAKRVAGAIGMHLQVTLTDAAFVEEMRALAGDEE